MTEEEGEKELGMRQQLQSEPRQAKWKLKEKLFLHCSTRRGWPIQR